MQYVADGYKSIGLLVDVNNDRLISALIIGVALAAVGWVGVEYAQSFIAQDVVTSTQVFL